MWLAFNGVVLLFLAIDLGVFHRKAHTVSLREATVWSVVWVGLALVFNGVIYVSRGADAGTQFLTGYLIEKALSVDNIFVFVMLFSYFAIPSQYQHRVLFWGILGALLMRGAFIGLGAIVLERFHWVLYVFGALLVLTGIKMARRMEAHDPSANPVLRLVRRWLPLTSTFHGQRFWVREDDPTSAAPAKPRWLATPLFLALVLVEVTDLVFAIDSIPAIFAITSDPFLVYTSNVFAILGLRSMYFLLAGVVHRFVYLKFGLAAVLVFVGAKMILVDVYKVPVGLSLGVVIVTIATSILASLAKTRDRAREAAVGGAVLPSAPGS